MQHLTTIKNKPMRVHLTLFPAERLADQEAYQSIESNDQLFLDMPARFNVGDNINDVLDFFPQEILGLTPAQEYALSLVYHVADIFWCCDKQGVYQDIWCYGE